MSEEASTSVDLSSLGSFDFTPEWAKKGEKVSVGKIRPERNDAGAARPASGAPRPERGGGPRQRRDDRPFQRRDDRQFQKREERPVPLDAEVKVLPESKALGTIMRKIQNDVHAYKLKDLAYFFLDNPETVLLRIAPRAAQGAEPPRFHQCRACGFASLREDEVAAHAVAAHIGDYFDTREIEVEPPKGTFTCVARCGLSGVLLGPPNLHEFNAIVREMIRSRFPGMPEDKYRARIEMVRDKDVIEQWRQEAVKKTVFVAKGQGEGAAELDREQAEGEFRRMFLPSLLDHPKHLMVTAAAALKSPSRPIVWAANDALEAERRAPYGMCFALRGAFHHRKMKFFRANDARGPEFVTNVEYREFDAEHAIPELAAASKFLVEHPCLDKSEFPADSDFAKHLNWLVSTGHAVAFTNGVFSAVEKFPKYGPQWKKRAKKQEENPEVKQEEKKDEVAAELAE